MNSIRLYLVSVIFICGISISFIVLLLGYQRGSVSTKALLDEQLQDVANLLVNYPATQTHYAVYVSEHFSYLVLDDPSSLDRLSKRYDLPFVDLQAGFDFADGQHGSWRTFTKYDPDAGRWILLAQAENQRSELVQELVFTTLMPFFLGLPVAILAVWFVIGRGLRPLRILTAKLHRKRSNNLEAIEIDNPPAELQPVITSVNQMLERLAQAFEHEQSFVANAAHEMRTPVSNLKIHLHNLKSELPHTSENFIQLTQAADHLAHMVEQLLTLYRSSTEGLNNAAESVAIDASLQQIIANHYLDIEQHEQIIELNCAPFHFSLNHFAFQSLIANILSNAIKYTPHGGRIHVTAHLKLQRLLITVEDSGPGVAQEDQQRMMERFVRLESTSHKPGSGLGLAIVAEAAKRIKAEIKFSPSADLGGLKISIAIPART